MIEGLTSEELKLCCADAYSNQLLSLVLGPAYHPGGEPLTRRMAELIDIQPNDRVLDLASGPGTSALLIAEEFGALVVGLDRTPGLVARAVSAAARRGVADRVSFLVADAEAVPLGDACADAVYCECSLCTFPDKRRAAADISRVLRPGGRVAVADISLDPASLPEELLSLAGWISCLAGALPSSAYCEILSGADLNVTAVESHDEALLEMIEQIASRLIAASIAGVQPSGLDPARVKQIAAMARKVATGPGAGYSLIVAEKPG